MQRLEVSGAVRPLYGSLGFKRLIVTPICLLGVLNMVFGRYKREQVI